MNVFGFLALLIGVTALLFIMYGECFLLMWAIWRIEKMAKMLPEADRERFINEQFDSLNKGVNARKNSPQ